MPKKLSTILSAAAVLTTIALMSYGQIWAKPPCEELRIFDNRIKVQFKPGCEEVLQVWFCVAWATNLDGTTGSCTNWRLSGPAIKTTMCTCEGVDCLDDTSGSPGSGLTSSLQKQGTNTCGNGGSEPCDISVECYPVKDTGPLSGCPIYLNPDRYTFGEVITDNLNEERLSLFLAGVYTLIHIPD